LYNVIVIGFDEMNFISY